MSQDTTLIFYEKPGCINHKKQAKLLMQSGVKVERRNLLACEFTVDSLAPYFKHLPRQQWLNPSAPALKKGAISPEILSDQELLKAMCDDRLLIRRPLLEYGEHCWAGFDWESVCEMLDLTYTPVNADLETCVRAR